VAPVVVLNRWVRVEPARGVVLLGLAADNPPNDVSGFWPSRKIAAPINPYEIQEHEVTWEELAPWVQASADAGIVLPELPSNNKKPAAGVTWKLAHEYCQSLGAHLPTEEEWEWAARGPERRPNTWGTSPVDPERTWFYKGATGQPVEVMSRDQDQTPAGVFDLEGNVQEWMADLYRDDEPPKNGVESRSRVGGTIFRTIRGLPLRQSMPATFPKEATAYRDALCASGQCAASVTEILKGVGFRCARRPTR
jgi:formylglycine-generating enzyme required for sulfatase activity